MGRGCGCELLCPAGQRAALNVCPPKSNGKGEAREARGWRAAPAAPGGSEAGSITEAPALPGQAQALRRASLTLSDFVTGHGNAVIITGRLLRALGSHAFSAAIFT